MSFRIAVYDQYCRKLPALHVDILNASCGEMGVRSIKCLYEVPEKPILQKINNDYKEVRTIKALKKEREQ